MISWGWWGHQDWNLVGGGATAKDDFGGKHLDRNFAGGGLRPEMEAVGKDGEIEELFRRFEAI
ncbi:hypothetical protein TIFTF001_014468 [Ficus carica]|uniref:Uncharacterized protein n=1 Tax=Ficus carica TaxID=3494 RepID=A0AA88D453_FICCA|nr:hypothetical protein TIFTF001_014468 [Ficus carica]